MLFVSVVRHYFLWHYTQSFSEIFHVWMNFIWFTIHFFSIPQLTRTLFSPWKRTIESRGQKWNIEELAGYIIIGLISRLVGFVLRSTIIIMGLVALALVIITGFIFYLIWFALPLVIIGLFVFGITLLIA